MTALQTFDRQPAWRLAAYSLAAVPLAMAALPIYVGVPKFYAEAIGLDLATIGGLLLASRIFDAVQDPLLGYWSDRWRETRSDRRIWLMAGAPLLAGAMLGLFDPPQLAGQAMAWWLLSMLLVVYTAFSMIQISYQAHGAEIASDRVERTRVVSYREGFGLAGVLLAAALPQAFSQTWGMREGYALFAWLFAPSALVLIALTVRLSPPPNVRSFPSSDAYGWRDMLQPLRNANCRRLLLIFMFNGIAAAIPATLVLFFIDEVIQSPRMSAIFLIVYFTAGAASMPMWTRLSAKQGKARAWLMGMLLSIAAFIWTFTLGPGDETAFLIICVFSGIGLGADLALPASMLADTIDDDEARGLSRREGAYFGLWNLLSKMNLALAAGLSLPLLAWLGYVPGSPGKPDSAGSAAIHLAAVYALLPCALKACAAFALRYSPFFVANLLHSTSRSKP